MEGFYYVIPAPVFNDSGLSPNAKLFYGIVANFCDKYGSCYASNSYFANLFNKSEDTVSRLVSELENNGYLQSIVDRKEGNKRTITLSAKMQGAIRKNADTYPQKCRDNNIINNITNNNTVDEVIDYLNEKTKSGFKKNNKATQGLINARLKEGYTVEDFKTVIDSRTSEWMGKEMEQYLTPSTLFRPSNFEKYLNFAQKEKSPQSIKPKTIRI